jgi:ribosomal protein S18 acetylase RimI-like enzyme
MPDPVRGRVERADLRLRPALPDDEEFLFGLYAATRAAELDRIGWDAATRAAFLRMQFSAQSIHYASHFPDAQSSVIELNGLKVGRLQVHRQEGGIHLVDIALLPEHRHRGIGTALVRELLDEAAARQCAVTLHVECSNPARAWYARLGFAEVDAHAVYVGMRCVPQDQAKIA